MKNLILLCLLFIPFILSAQTYPEGEVIYAESVQLKFDFGDNPQMEAIKGKLPSSRKSQKQLLFKEGQALYQVYEDESGDVDIQEENLQIKIVRPQSVIFHDMKKGEMVESRDFMSRKFLITSKKIKHKWKITSEQKEILGYHCQKAVFQDSSMVIEAWFTTQIPLSIGPANFRGLPGLILEVSRNQGERRYVAESINLKRIDGELIKAPTKGKEVSGEEFVKIVEEKVKEMKLNQGGGTQFRIHKN